MTELRTIDGTGNQLNPTLLDAGSAGTALARHPLAPATYPGDGSGEQILESSLRPNPREISNALAAQGGVLMFNDRRLSNFVWQWGQFLDHDLDLSTGGPEAGTANIPVPEGDILGPGPIPFSRSHYLPGTGAPGVPRQQINAVTAFIDASNVYGSDPVRAAALRTDGGSGARLLTSEGNLLPYNTLGLENAGGSDPHLFLAGDIRANEQIGLTSMHTLFVREHNRLVDALAALPGPARDEETLYQMARKIVGAEMQIITYNEFLPVLLGVSPASLDSYEGYDDSVDPSIRNEFSTAFYRVGHTMLSPILMMTDNDGLNAGYLELRDCFFNPGLMSEPGDADKLDLILKGLASYPMQEVDTRVVEDVRSFLFGPPGAGGMDLASLNIQRGRDHGLPDYNTLREAYGLGRVSTFAEMTSNAEVQSLLASLYGSVDNIDAWVGGLAEDHVPGASVGETIHRVVSDQFFRLRDGDRFFYLSDPDLSHPDYAAVVDLENLRLGDIIRWNTGISNLQPNVFMIPEPPTLVLALLAASVFRARIGRKGATPCSDELRPDGNWPGRAAGS